MRGLRVHLRGTGARTFGRYSKRVTVGCSSEYRSSAKRVDLSIFHEALKHEETCNFVNSKGYHGVFSVFASRTVKSMRDIPMEMSQEHTRLSVAFEHYESIDRGTRKKTIASAKNFISQLTSPQTLSDAQERDTSTNIVTAPETSNSSLELVQKEKLDSLVLKEQNKNGLASQDKTQAEMFREMFTKTAEISCSNDDSMTDKDQTELEQGSPRWHAIRQEKLTASSFANVLGMFGNPQECMRNVWLEKIGMKPPFKGNEMTAWGSKHEKEAFESYQLITDHDSTKRGIGLMGSHVAESWIGASPDWLLTVNPSGRASLLPEKAKRLLFPKTDEGILEIKCPYGSRYGNPEYARPYEEMRSYYIPQVQCQMDVFDREWCHLFSWTKRNGSRIFLVERNREYYEQLYCFLATFWWEHVIPAKRCLQEGQPHLIDKYDPTGLDPSHLIQASAKLALSTPNILFDSHGMFLN